MMRPCPCVLGVSGQVQENPRRGPSGHAEVLEQPGLLLPIHGPTGGSEGDAGGVREGSQASARPPASRHAALLRQPGPSLLRSEHISVVLVLVK